MHEANDSSSTANSYAATCDYLYALRNQGSKYGLERMQAFLACLKNPQEGSIRGAGWEGQKFLNPS